MRPAARRADASVRMGLGGLYTAAERYEEAAEHSTAPLSLSTPRASPPAWGSGAPS